MDVEILAAWRGFVESGGTNRCDRILRNNVAGRACRRVIIAMPLSQYGLLKGALFTPKEQTYQGNWFHGIFYLTVPGAAIPQRCVTDFSSANKDRIQYKIFNNLSTGLFAAIMALPDGYASLGI